MNKALLSAILLFYGLNASGQKTELNVCLSSGLFSFTGGATASRSFINYDETKNTGYTNNPYGSGKGLCYGLGLNLKKISARHVILGIEIGFENLRSKMLIDGVSAFTMDSSYGYAASGKTFLANNFIDLFPSLGYRYKAAEAAIDLNGGFDAGFLMSTTEHGKASAANGKEYITDRDRTNNKIDIRPRIQLSLTWHKIGAYLGYAVGLANYTYKGGGDVTAKLIRFGLSYQLK
jgi:hypothetical protein